MITRDINDGIRDERFLHADHDEICYPDKKMPRNQLLRLRQRTNAVNKLYLTDRDKFQRVVIIHMDSRSKNEDLDVYFYYDNRSKSGKKLSEILLNKLKEKYNQHQPGRGYDGTVSSRNLYVLQNTYPTATFIELGNMNHKQNQKRFLIADNRQALANWLADGLIQDFEEDNSK
jgi:N-acetylmuramoyl-L-alanine amidase